MPEQARKQPDARRGQVSPGKPSYAEDREVACQSNRHAMVFQEFSNQRLESSVAEEPIRFFDSLLLREQKRSRDRQTRESVRRLDAGAMPQSLECFQQIDSSRRDFDPLAAAADRHSITPSGCSPRHRSTKNRRRRLYTREYIFGTHKTIAFDFPLLCEPRQTAADWEIARQDRSMRTPAVPQVPTSRAKPSRYPPDLASMRRLSSRRPWAQQPPREHAFSLCHFLHGHIEND